MKKFSLKTSKGFSLLELLIVITIIVILSTIGAGFYMNYGKTIEINSLGQSMVFDLKQAQSKSMIGEGGLKYGIHFVNSTADYYEIFSTPTDYNDGTKIIISNNYLNNGITFSDPTEGQNKDVIFNKISGSTTAATVSITARGNTKTINISAIGTISSTDVGGSGEAGAGTLYCDGSGATFSCGNSCVYNGDTYSTVLIGTQCWFAENLRTTKYPNGSDITKGDATQGAGSAAWFNYSTQYYSCPPNAGNTGEDCASAGNSNKLGMLYQWKTIMNGSTSVATGSGPQGICPSGWQIPTDDNTVSSGFGKLYSYVESLPGCVGDSGTCLKVGGSTGFNMPFAGARNGSGDYINRGIWFNIWSSSESASNSSWFRRLYYTGSSLGRNDDWKPVAYSVRCLKN